MLNRCAYVLYDEINVGSNHWYDCASIFDENAVIILINNEENSNEVFDELESNSWKISEYGL